MPQVRLIERKRKIHIHRCPLDTVQRQRYSANSDVLDMLAFERVEEVEKEHGG